jgi:UDP-4-amino-4,6-dideoxy-N-acetyl-beta-L-altrosamine N-acetyltransferase
MELGVTAARSIPAGAMVRRTDLRVFAPSSLRIIGARTSRPITAGQMLGPEDVAPLELASGAVKLVPLAEEHTDHILRWRALPEVANELFSERAPTRAEHLAFLARLHDRVDRIEFVILYNDAPAGTIGLSDLDPTRDDAEYGILTGEPSLRGRGIATIASRLLIDYAFTALGLRRIRLSLFDDNTAAKRLYQKLGFIADGERPARSKGGKLRAVCAMYVDAAAR